MAEIQRWTKRSLSSKPFCLVADKDWTNRSSKIDVRKIYTNLILATKSKEPSGVEEQLWDDTTALFKYIGFGKDDPIRILVQGKEC